MHAADVVAAMRLALTSDEWSGPMVIGSGTSLSVLQVVDAVREISGAELDVTHGPAKPGEMPAVIVDPSRARGRLVAALRELCRWPRRRMGGMGDRRRAASGAGGGGAK